MILTRQLAISRRGFALNDRRVVSEENLVAIRKRGGRSSERLAEIRSVDIVLPTVEGREIWLRRISKLDEQHKELFTKLRLQLPERLEPIQIQKCSADSAAA